MREKQEKAEGYIDFMAVQIKSEPGDIYPDEIRISSKPERINPGFYKELFNNHLICNALSLFTPARIGLVIIFTLNNKHC